MKKKGKRRPATKKKPVEPIYNVIGARIAELRVFRGLTQAELGERLHPPLSRMHVSNIEHANQRVMVHTVLEICWALDCAPGDVLPAIIRL